MYARACELCQTGATAAKVTFWSSPADSARPMASFMAAMPRSRMDASSPAFINAKPFPDTRRRLVRPCPPVMRQAHRLVFVPISHRSLRSLLFLKQHHTVYPAKPRVKPRKKAHHVGDLHVAWQRSSLQPSIAFQPRPGDDPRPSSLTCYLRCSPAWRGLRRICPVSKVTITLLCLFCELRPRPRAQARDFSLHPRTHIDDVCVVNPT